MKRSIGVLLIVFSTFLSVSAQTTAFSYQGSLRDNNTPANGSFQMQFKLFDSLGGAGQIGSTITDVPVTVTSGVFSVRLDFGSNALSGANRWIEIAVRHNSGESYTTLAPREQLASSPYAVRTLSAAMADDSQKLGGVNASEYVTNSTGGDSFIRNQATLQPTSNFNISGTGTASIFNATTQYNLGGSRILSNSGTQNLFAGINAGASNTTGSDNAFLGHSAGSSNTTGFYNSFFGSFAGVTNTTGSQNSFFGNSAGSANTTGQYNAFFGNWAGLQNTTGLDNSFFGTFAGQLNTTGQGNSFFGKNAGLSNTTGGSNSYFGALAGENTNNVGANSFFGYKAGNQTSTSSNSFFGYFAGQANSAGFFNSFFGIRPGFQNTTGSRNSFFGNDAGGANTTGSDNTLIGASADVGSGNLNYAAAIGSGAIVTQSNSIVLGRAPGVDFVGIGISAPVRTLDVNGRARISNIPLLASAASVCFNGQGDLLQCGASSLKWKTDVRPFNLGLETILRLRPINFRWKENGSKDFGLGAEDVAKVAPELAFTDENGEIKGVKYDRLNVVFINAFKEQQKLIEIQRREIDALRKLVCRSNRRAEICREKKL